MMNQNNNEQPIQCESKKHLRKPEWIRIKLPCNNSATKMKNMLRSHHHHTVCEEAACPNQAECFNLGTATFLIMGGVCTRNCRFCNVKKGRPQPLNPNEPDEIARSVQEMQLKYVVITSVDRDDLADGGATHYLECMKKTRALNPHVKIEILVPDFKNCMDNALEILSKSPADVFNHNLETVPRLFKSITPGCSYELSLTVLQKHKERFPEIPTKSGLMLGLGETDDELIEVMQDLRQHNVDMLTLGQYLQPSRQHLPVDRYVPPEKFDEFAKIATKMGFSHVASGPLVRSSYHAEEQWTKKK